MSKLNIGLFGFGVVGEGFYRLLAQSQWNKEISIKKIVIKEADKPRSAPSWLFTTDKHEVLEDPEINVVVEAITDPEDALLIAKRTLKSGKVLISASKKVISENLPLLQALAAENAVPLLYEAAVCGGIPVIRNIKNYLSQDRIEGIKGILNGSSNFILSKIFQENISYEKALKAAQELGFAEADPSLDVSGRDASHKLSILIAAAYGTYTSPNHIPQFGIDSIHERDIAYAKEKGQKIKLINISQRSKEGKITSFVLPTLVKSEDALFHVENEFNAVEVRGALSGAHTWIGKGAGSFPTGLAVFNDVVSLLSSTHQERPSNSLNEAVADHEENDLVLNLYVRSEQALSEKFNSYVIEKSEIQSEHIYEVEIPYELLSLLTEDIKASKGFLALQAEGIDRKETLPIQEEISSLVI